MAKEDVVHLRWKAALRKKARLPFAPTHLNLEDIMLSGVNQTEKYDAIPLVCETRESPTDRNRAERGWPGPRERGGQGEMPVGGQHRL